MLKVMQGKEGLNLTWQAPFPETVSCTKCGGEARHALTFKEEHSHSKVEPLYKLYDNKGEGDYWLHDYCAIAIYFCKDCLASTSKYNQG